MDGEHVQDWPNEDWPNKEAVKYLWAPDGTPHMAAESPRVTPFKDPLIVPPVKEAASEPLEPAPDPGKHQRYHEFQPQMFYTTRQQEFLWQFHSDYGRKTWTWGFDGCTPGPTYHARYGQPLLVRRTNDLPPLGYTKLPFCLPSSTVHLHNGHQASESDGYPMDAVEPGEHWDHHYPNLAATIEDTMSGGRVPDDREKLATLWYHDHRMGFTAANVYAGLVGFYCLFDEQDSGDENDPNPTAWRLPSGEHDVPLLLHGLLFNKDHQLLFDSYAIHGVLGDRFTVNRVIQPHFEVKRRKYRFRILDGGPSRFYQLFLNSPTLSPAGAEEQHLHRFIVISGDGNFQPEPVEAESIYMGVAQRVDVIIDFSTFKAGDQIYLENRLDQMHGHGPSGRMITDPEEIRSHRLMRFDVVGDAVDDPSRVPDFFRPFPPIDRSIIKRERTWNFDYDGGIWTINSRPMHPNRIDAGIERDSAEIWTYRNNGNSWHHPIHSHLSEWLVLEVNGVPVRHDTVQIMPKVRGTEAFQRVFTKERSEGSDYALGTNVLRGPWCGGFRRDVALLGPRTEIKLYSRWPDFVGKYILHCHNVVHEDHSMMARWDVLPPGQGFDGPRWDWDVYGGPMLPQHLELQPAHAAPAHGSRFPGLTTGRAGEGGGHAGGSGMDGGGDGRSMPM